MCMALGKRVKERRISLGLTQQQVADAVGVSQVSIRNLEARDSKSSRKTSALAKILQTTPLWLETGTGNISVLDNTEITNCLLSGRVPEISYVQAGEFTEAIDIHEVGQADKFHPRIIPGEHVYVLRVVGDSMTSPHGKSFPEEMLLHVDGADRSPNNGDFIIARLNGTGDVTFKQFKHGETRPYLHALNPRHDPIYDEFSVLGVIGFAGWKL